MDFVLLAAEHIRLDEFLYSRGVLPKRAICEC
jgi:hypothetical protein